MRPCLAVVVYTLSKYCELIYVLLIKVSTNVVEDTKSY
jgi:hypothetical protein